MAPKRATWRSFAEARAFVHTLGLKNQGEWLAYCRSGRKPASIPSHPQTVYRTEWRGLGDWLGTGTIASRNRQYRPFAEARAFVHTLGLKNKGEWSAYRRPADIPSTPEGLPHRVEWFGRLAGHGHHRAAGPSVPAVRRGACLRPHARVEEQGRVVRLPPPGTC